MTQDDFNEKVLTLSEDLVTLTKNLTDRVDSLEANLAWAGTAIFLLSVLLMATIAWLS